MFEAILIAGAAWLVAVYVTCADRDPEPTNHAKHATRVTCLRTGKYMRVDARTTRHERKQLAMGLHRLTLRKLEAERARWGVVRWNVRAVPR